MKKAPLILLVCVMMGISAFAQTRPNRALYLNMGGSSGIASSYDNGTVPFFITGVSKSKPLASHTNGSAMSQISGSAALAPL